jgi:hypothetical protein
VRIKKAGAVAFPDLEKLNIVGFGRFWTLSIKRSKSWAIIKYSFISSKIKEYFLWI